MFREASLKDGPDSVRELDIFGRRIGEKSTCKDNEALVSFLLSRNKRQPGTGGSHL
jgi:hypothetical protein